MNNLFNLAGTDGMKHIILSATLTVVAKWLLSVWVAVGVVMAIGIAKEIYDKVSGRGIAKEVYDKVSEKGCCEWKDIMCDIIGIIIGAL